MRIKDFLFGSSIESSPLADVGLLVLRFATGIALALQHGYGKLLDPTSFITKAVIPMGIPAPTIFGWLAIFSEFFGGILLALGLLTRPAAFFVLCVMLTAYFTVHINDPFARKELAVLYGLIAIAFLLKSSGRYGFDALLRGNNRGSSRR
ncbi:MAG: DoxX family protein [Pyrinomonadaceae bacterium MAG19_C2-C3]|nr:DoxX family protein [Pyrinomonadaceae bacterium MAG19_C2-C3]